MNKSFSNKALLGISILILLINIKLLFTGKEETGNVPIDCWPQFDNKAPFTLNGPLWVGYDKKAKKWKYVKILQNKISGELQRGLVDPGNPKDWTDETGQLGYFDGELHSLPSGTHINNRYDPTTMAFKFEVDDIMVKVGNFWVDKYEASLVVIKNNAATFMDDPKYGGIDSLNKSKTGTAYDLPTEAIAVSQRRRGTSGLTFFVAQQAAINNGKQLVSNEQWQAAASGTSRSDATGMVSGGETWDKINDIDISRYGIVGCAGSLWEWTSSWGQYGQHYTGTPTNWYDWPGPGSYAEWDDKYDTYGNDIIINVAGRAYTRQDSARYATGLPSALVRGGSWGDHNRAGIFALIADGAPSYYGVEVGFRCVK